MNVKTAVVWAGEFHVSFNCPYCDYLTCHTHTTQRGDANRHNNGKPMLYYKQTCTSCRRHFLLRGEYGSETYIDRNKKYVEDW